MFNWTVSQAFGPTWGRWYGRVRSGLVKAEGENGNEDWGDEDAGLQVRDSGRGKDVEMLTIISLLYYVVDGLVSLFC